MFRSKMLATVGAVAAAAACTVLATPVASAAPAPTCLTCWTPRVAPPVSTLSASVGSGILQVRF